MADAIYFRVSSDRQTTENQFEEVLAEYGRIYGVDLGVLEELKASVEETPAPTEKHPDRTVFRPNRLVVEKLAKRFVYVEQGKSGKTGSVRPMFERMKGDARLKMFDRLLVWKVSRLGRDMREVLNTVYELSDLGITVYPVKSTTGPITSSMGKLLWAILAWFSEMENAEKTEAIQAGLRRAREKGTNLGRPKKIFDRAAVMVMHDQGATAYKIGKALGIAETTVRRAIEEETERLVVEAAKEQERARIENAKA